MNATRFRAHRPAFRALALLSLTAAAWSPAAAQTYTTIDLNPTMLVGITSSDAQGVSGSTEVGYGNGTAISNQNHALLWKGTAGSAIDLNAFLPAGFDTSSMAYAINSTGDVVGTASGASGSHAFLWRLVAPAKP